MADPLAYKGYVTARWGAQMLGAMDKIKSEAATKTTYPFFVIYGTDDIATNMAGGEYLIQNAKNSKYGRHHKIVASRVVCVCGSDTRAQGQAGQVLR
jgi:alpha-beta hydrolase superfamily lysophospholipase